MSITHTFSFQNCMRNNGNKQKGEEFSPFSNDIITGRKEYSASQVCFIKANPCSYNSI